ncbi:MAG TPA: radical SAM protein [Deltaproteobacteria bacterium]|nr:radical SAM protein [Deltaproteobacteria bacterium]
MKILLVNPPWYRLQGASLVHYPPGPCFVAGALEKAGYEPVVWNADFDPAVRSVIGGTNVLDTDELTQKHSIYQKNLNDLSAPVWREVASMIERFAPDVLGVSVYSATYKAALNVARIAKEVNPAVTTVFGGIHPTIATEEVASQRDVDFVVFGEGERTVVELVGALEARDGAGRDFSSIKGIAFKDGDGNVVRTERREYIEDLDAEVYPARHLIHDVESYPPTAFQGIYGSRGCPFKCIFCGSFNLWGYSVRTRSAETLVAEIEETHRRFGTRYFYLCDDIFFINRERARRFCELLIEKDLGVMWSAQTRAEMVTDELLALMKKAGGQHVAIGVETGDERIRKLIKKGNTLEQMRRAARLVHKHGLTLVGFFMFGFPWESREEIRRTVEFMKEINPTIAFPYIVTPAPGTELSQISHEMGLVGPDRELENFYHESPEMCLSVNIPEEERKGIIDETLKVFAEHNKKRFRLDVLKRPRFYYTLFHDFGFFRNPMQFVQVLRDVVAG